MRPRVMWSRGPRVFSSRDQEGHAPLDQVLCGPQDQQRNPGYVELAPVFQPLCGGGSVQVPRESQGTLGTSGDFDWRGKTVWRDRGGSCMTQLFVNRLLVLILLTPQRLINPCIPPHFCHMELALSSAPSV